MGMLIHRHRDREGQAPTGPAPEFDPSAESVDAVLAYLTDAGEAERARVLSAEQAGKARKGVLDA